MIRNPSQADQSEVVEHIVKVARRLVELAEAELPVAIGAALAGLVGLDGVVLRSPNAPGLEGVDVAARLVAATGIPVVVDNDANCVAVAAATLRREPVRDLVAITLGTGIGGGFIVDGRLVRGSRGFAGEPGHMVVDPAGPLCPCGQHGCWERYASGSGLEALAAEAVSKGRGDDLVGPDGTIDGEGIIAAAAAGSPQALAVLEEFGAWFALGVANLINLLDPAVVVIGGGITAAGDTFLDPVRAALAAHPLAASHDFVIEVAPGGPEAGAVGAAISAVRAVGV